MYIPDDCHHFYYVCSPHAALGMKGLIIAHHPPVFGCMDSTASNYDSTANHDDGSCIYLGCTDPTATNYDSNATQDDGSCNFCVPFADFIADDVCKEILLHSQIFQCLLIL